MSGGKAENRIQKEDHPCVICGLMQGYGEFWGHPDGKCTGFVCANCRDDLELFIVDGRPSVWDAAKDAEIQKRGENKKDGIPPDGPGSPVPK